MRCAIVPDSRRTSTATLPVLIQPARRQKPVLRWCCSFATACWPNPRPSLTFPRIMISLFSEIVSQQSSRAPPQVTVPPAVTTEHVYARQRAPRGRLSLARPPLTFSSYRTEIADCASSYCAISTSAAYSSAQENRCR